MDKKKFFKKDRINIIGGGLAGVEAARQITSFGINVSLFEMKPVRYSEAHKSENLAELVCSNSLKSNSIENAGGILKEEMRLLNSLVIEAADNTSVPAGKALAVNRDLFTEYITERIEKNSKVELRREVYSDIENDVINLIATGPLTSEELVNNIMKMTGQKNLYFYDSISPIINSDSIDYSKVFRASRYENEVEGDYINCPFSKEQYYALVNEIIKAEKVELHEFEDTGYFESCMPIEVMCERGIETLRFGPMKPVGLTDPKTGKIPFAVVQLRMENNRATMYNIVGFQTKLTYPEQRRIFRMIPGLENVEFFRYGSIHRNTYLRSPDLLNEFIQLESNKNIFFAGQITGVEGYVESAATGIIAGINAAMKFLGREMKPVPPESSIGSLISYISGFSGKNFQPININFGIYPDLGQKLKKDKKRELIAKKALDSIMEYKAVLSC
jgi:methylenetetrahydrofolate--tRNA-(uracil-5-)-methyltransferase